MLHYYKIYLDEDKAIYRYILDKDPEIEGIVELDRHEADRFKAYKIIKKAKDDIFCGAGKLGVNLFKMNQENDFDDEGLIAWH